LSSYLRSKNIIN